MSGVGRVAFVTGGSSGIGAATVARLIHEQYKVAFMDVDSVSGLALQEKLGGKDKCLFCQGNVGIVKDIESCVSSAVKEYGPINALFANAGIYRGAELLDLTENEFDEVMTINLKGCVFTVKSVLRVMVDAGIKGSLVLMSSDQAFVGKSRSAAYGMTKAAIASLTKTTAVDYAKHGIRCNAVCPATIRTPLSSTAMEQWATQQKHDVNSAWEADAKQHLLGRVGTPAEVANLVNFLLSDESSFMTGGLYLIDGGFTTR